jgi:hypothetical protein
MGGRPVSARSWAVTVTCDYPGCQSVGDSKALDDPPAGWLSLHGPAMRVADAYGRQLLDLCSLHSSIPLDKLAGVLREQLEKEAQ